MHYYFNRIVLYKVDTLYTIVYGKPLFFNISNIFFYLKIFSGLGVRGQTSGPVGLLTGFSTNESAVMYEVRPMRARSFDNQEQPQSSFSLLSIYCIPISIKIISFLSSVNRKFRLNEIQR